MVVIIEDKKIRNVKLTGDEIDMFIEMLEREPHNIFKFFNCDKIIVRLKGAKEGKKKK